MAAFKKVLTRPILRNQSRSGFPARPAGLERPAYNFCAPCAHVGKWDTNAAVWPQPKVADCSAIERLDRGAVRDIRAVRACWQL